MGEYLNNLQAKMVSSNYSVKYIELCLNYAGYLQSNSAPVIFDVEHFCLILKIELNQLKEISESAGAGYDSFEIIVNYKKRSILSPNGLLKQIQKWIQVFILKPIKVSKWATAYKPKSSIFKNASFHIKQPCVVNLDLRHFFESITEEKVNEVFRNLGYTAELSNLFTKLCTFDGYLPQGAPTSPYLSNLVCKELDKKLAIICEKEQINFTRYADDLTFSGDCGIVGYLSNIKNEIQAQGFKVNEDKTRISYWNQRQEVTGLVVNEKVSIKKEFIRQLSQEINYCIRFGVSSHMRRARINNSNYKDHLFGKAYFVKAVNKSLGNKFLQKLNRINWEY